MKIVQFIDQSSPPDWEEKALSFTQRSAPDALGRQPGGSVRFSMAKYVIVFATLAGETSQDLLQRWAKKLGLSLDMNFANEEFVGIALYDCTLAESEKLFNRLLKSAERANDFFHAYLIIDGAEVHRYGYTKQ